MGSVGNPERGLDHDGYIREEAEEYDDLDERTYYLMPFVDEAVEEVSPDPAAVSRHWRVADNHPRLNRGLLRRQNFLALLLLMLRRFLLLVVGNLSYSQSNGSLVNNVAKE